MVDRDGSIRRPRRRRRVHAGAAALLGLAVGALAGCGDTLTGPAPAPSTWTPLVVNSAQLLVWADAIPRAGGTETPPGPLEPAVRGEVLRWNRLAIPTSSSPP